MPCLCSFPIFKTYRIDFAMFTNYTTSAAWFSYFTIIFTYLVGIVRLYRLAHLSYLQYANIFKLQTARDLGYFLLAGGIPLVFYLDSDKSPLTVCVATVFSCFSLYWILTSTDIHEL